MNWFKKVAFHRGSYDVGVQFTPTGFLDEEGDQLPPGISEFLLAHAQSKRSTPDRVTGISFVFVDKYDLGWELETVAIMGPGAQYVLSNKDASTFYEAFKNRLEPYESGQRDFREDY